MLVLGSSPLARGLRAPNVIMCRQNTDHPRSRGVYTCGRRITTLLIGSSPLARGLPCVPIWANYTRRIIPARAGFTDINARNMGNVMDHPRSRGVYARRAGLCPLQPGSSPLARGLPRLRKRRDLHTGIIPARAGFTSHIERQSECVTDHPRSRGVYLGGYMGREVVGGSSPLARGLLLACGPHAVGSRIIPARAGFTPRGTPARRSSPDHPRSRGVYVVGRCTRRGLSGSSPLARGLLTNHLLLILKHRIIPARAGFTAVRSATFWWTRGSSPLARGLHQKRSTMIFGQRIIPARAGFTVL